MKNTMKKSIAFLLAIICVIVIFAGCAKEEDDKNSADSKTITVEVTDDTAETQSFTITTEEETLRGALEQENLVEGTESEYGLYVTTVNGVTADWDADQSYWAFYKDDEYLSTGVDDTIIADGDTYQIVYTK